MSEALKGLYFFARFAHRFSRLGYQESARAWSSDAWSFAGQRWLVTGASGGIGKAITETAAKDGASVTALARSRSKLDGLSASGGEIKALEVDLSLSAEIRRALDELEASGEPPLDVLVNNVGVLLNDHALSDEGVELSFATNLLNHFLLTEGLLARNLLAPDAVIVNMSSGGMYNVPLLIEPLNNVTGEGYNGVTAYAFHKRAQVVLNDWWQRRYGGDKHFYVMHPGWVDTQGVKTSLPGFRALFRRILRNADEGADTALWLAARRPEVPAEPSIWLDRSLQPAHISRETEEQSASAEDLVAFLQELAESVGAAS